MQRRFGMQPNTSGHSKSLRAGARYGLKMSMKIKNNPCKKENFPLIFFSFFTFGSNFSMFPRSSFFQETGPWLKEKTVWGRIFFKIEEKRKIGNFPEQLRNSFPEKFCCKLDTKTLLSRFPIFIFLPYKGKFVLSVGNLLFKLD